MSLTVATDEGRSRAESPSPAWGDASLPRTQGAALQLPDVSHAEGQAASLITQERPGFLKPHTTLSHAPPLIPSQPKLSLSFIIYKMGQLCLPGCVTDGRWDKAR